MIANCGHDERGKHTGGKPGDQTGAEWQVRGWYDRGWNVVLRHPNQMVGNTLVTLALQAAHNDHIGYCQGHRMTFYEMLKMANWDPSKITLDCETDCSAGTCALVIAAGYHMKDQKLQAVSPYLTTWYMRLALKMAGFIELTDAKYLRSDQYLLPGDILLLESAHVAINLTKGALAHAQHNEYTTATPTGIVKQGFERSIAGRYRVKASSLNLRKTARTDTDNILCNIGHGQYVQNYGYYATSEGRKWYYVVYMDMQGYVASEYIEKIG